MLIEIKTKESTEYIEVDRVENTEDKVYYDRNNFNSSIIKKDCEYIDLWLSNGSCKVLYSKEKSK